MDAWLGSAPGSGSPTPSARSGEEGRTVPISNNGPFRIFAASRMEYRMFVCEDGIVLVRPRFWRHFPSRLIAVAISAVAAFVMVPQSWEISRRSGEGIGEAVEADMGVNEYQQVDRIAKEVGFVSSERLAASVSRSIRYPADQVEAVTFNNGELIFVIQSRQRKSPGSRKLRWLLGKDDLPAQIALKQLFEGRFATNENTSLPPAEP
jgi:hypothetical protein